MGGGILSLGLSLHLPRAFLEAPGRTCDKRLVGLTGILARKMLPELELLGPRKQPRSSSQSQPAYHKLCDTAQHTSPPGRLLICKTWIKWWHWGLTRKCPCTELMPGTEMLLPPSIFILTPWALVRPAPAPQGPVRATDLGEGDVSRVPPEGTREMTHRGAQGKLLSPGAALWATLRGRRGLGSGAGAGESLPGGDSALLIKRLL